MWPSRPAPRSMPRILDDAAILVNLDNARLCLELRDLLVLPLPPEPMKQPQPHFVRKNPLRPIWHLPAVAVGLRNLPPHLVVRRHDLAPPRVHPCSQFLSELVRLAKHVEHRRTLHELILDVLSMRVAQIGAEASARRWNRVEALVLDGQAFCHAVQCQQPSRLVRRHDLVPLQRHSRLQCRPGLLHELRRMEMRHPRVEHGLDPRLVRVLQARPVLASGRDCGLEALVLGGQVVHQRRQDTVVHHPPENAWHCKPRVFVRRLENSAQQFGELRAIYRPPADAERLFRAVQQSLPQCPKAGVEQLGVVVSVG
mmetsp:Transcript_2487/g.7506  ORF Transcript_2487/g.7506 Transcript_2487/m.7506 type:complete len:312 (+) Transcript_2487:49-984(+)